MENNAVIIFNKQIDAMKFTDVQQYSKNKGRLYQMLGDVEKLAKTGAVDQKTLHSFLLTVQKACQQLRTVQDQLRITKKEKPRTRLQKAKIWFALKTGVRLNSVTKKANEIAKSQQIAIRAPMATDKARGALRKLAGLQKGATQSGTKPLDADYWMETRGLRLEFPQAGQAPEIVKGRFWMGIFTTLNHGKIHKDWLNVQHKYGFEEYLNKVYIPSLSAEERAEFRKQLTNVDYFTPEELTFLTPRFEKGAVKMSPLFCQWVKGVDRFSLIQQTPFQEYVRQQTAEDAAAGPEDALEGGASFESFEAVIQEARTTLAFVPPPAMKYIFVLTHEGQLRVCLKQRGNINHSSLSRGETILSAGEITTDENGHVKLVTALSGHYKPLFAEMMTMLEYLERQGIKTDDITFLQNDEILKGAQMKARAKERTKEMAGQLDALGLTGWRDQLRNDSFAEQVRVFELLSKLPPRKAIKLLDEAAAKKDLVEKMDKLQTRIDKLQRKLGKQVDLPWRKQLKSDSLAEHVKLHDELSEAVRRLELRALREPPADASNRQRQERQKS